MIRKTAIIAYLFFAASLLAQGNKPVALLKGEVESSEGEKISSVQVSVFKGSENINSGKTNTDGKFQIILKPDATYTVTYYHPKYYSKEEKITVPELEKYREIAVKATLRPLDLNRPYAFCAMIFEPKSAKIENAVLADLETIVSTVKRNKVSLKITVYPDETPSGKKAAAQMSLANSRKSALTTFFLTHNISASSFTCDVSPTAPTGGASFERVITAEPETGKKKKAKTKPAAAKNTRVSQYAEIVMQ
jgi:hypothetical protein